MRTGKRQRKQFYFLAKDGKCYVFGYMGRVERGRILVYNLYAKEYDDLGLVGEVEERLRRLANEKRSYRADYDFSLDVSPRNFLQMLLVGLVTREDLNRATVIPKENLLVVNALWSAFSASESHVGLQLYVSPGDLGLWQDYKENILPILK